MGKVFQLYREVCGDDYWDCKYRIEQPMCEMPEINEENIKEIILNDILSRYPGTDETAVKAVLNGTMEKYSFIEEKDVEGNGLGRFFTLKDWKDSWEYWEIYLKEKKDDDIVQEVRVTFLSKYEYKNDYWVEEINNPKYFVIETLGAPLGRIMEARKILAGPFGTREEANAAKENVTKHRYVGPQDVDVFGIDIMSPSAQSWLKCASEILELEQRFDTIEERDRYCLGDNQGHLDNLRIHFGLDIRDEDADSIATIEWE